MDAKLQAYIDKLNALNFKEMYNGDFFLTWEKSDDELEAVFTVADALRYMRENNISTKVFESGLGISLFRDNSTRTRFSFASACNLLGSPSWLTLSVSAMICTSAKATNTCMKLLTL